MKKQIVMLLLWGAPLLLQAAEIERIRQALVAAGLLAGKQARKVA